MVWVKVDDDFPQHPKARKAGPVGMALWLAGLCYSSHYLTDGLVPVEVLSGLLPLEKKELTRTVDKLVFSGLWSVAEGGYQIHDYLDYQSSRTEVLAERERVRKWRENKKRTRTEPVRDNDAPDAVQRPTPTPIPTQQQQNPPVNPPLPERGTAGAKRRSSGIPTNWTPSETLTSWANAKHPTVDLEAATEGFLNHAEDKGRTTKSTEAAWRNWIIKAEDWGPHKPGTTLALTNGNGHHPGRSQNQINADAVARRMGLNPADTDPFGTAPDEPWRTL